MVNKKQKKQKAKKRDEARAEQKREMGIAERGRGNSQGEAGSVTSDA